MRTLLLVAAVTLAIAASAEGQPTRATSNPCVSVGAAPPRLLPADEAPSKPEFLQYRERLRGAVERRDVDALIDAADPGIRLGFDASGGASALRAQFGSRSESWEQLRAVLALGGSFSSPSSFEAPYVYARWPDQLDSFACAAVTGSNVRVRTVARLDAPIVALVSFAIVRLVPDQDNRSWARVQLADGRGGYMSRRYVRSPADYRALFTLSDGRWRMTAFVAGD